MPDFLVSTISSVSHDIDTKESEDNVYQIDLKQKRVIPNKDFVLEYRIESGKEPKAALFTATKDDENYFMLMAVPPVKLEKDLTIQKEMIFVIDISGSMDGESIVQARAGLINALKRLNPGDTFNIIAFNDKYDSMDRFPIEATGDNVLKGVRFVKRLKANGGTMAQPALRHALLMNSQQNRVKMIVFLTDGDVGNEDELITLVKDNIGSSRLFTVGIGSAPNGYLLEKVSRSGRGTFTYISKISEVEQKMNTLLTRIEHPVLTDVSLHIPGQVELYPGPVPDLFSGEPLVVFGKISRQSNGGARFIGKSPAGYFRLDLPLDLKKAKVEPAIPTLWARSKISNLMDEYRLGNENIKEDIIKLAISHKLMTKFTSFVAVEQRVVNLSGKSRLSAIPTEIPEGWKIEKVFKDKGSSIKPVLLPQTASSAPLTALAGFLLILSGLMMISIKVWLARGIRNV